MTAPTAVELLREMAADLPAEAEDHALAALAALADPAVATAAMAEQLTQERLALAEPHLVKGRLAIVMDETGGRALVGDHDCPDCTRGTRSIRGVLVCIQLPDRVGTMDGKVGDVVACGRER